MVQAQEKIRVEVLTGKIVSRYPCAYGCIAEAEKTGGSHVVAET